MRLGGGGDAACPARSGLALLSFGRGKDCAVVIWERA